MNGPPSPRVSVIIPVHNHWDLTRQCLESLAAHDPGLPAAGVEVLVADNGSTDETAAACPELGRALFGDRFRVVRSETPKPFGPGCNAAAREAAGTFLFFLNNDTILTPGWCDPLTAALEEDDRLAGVGPLLLYPDTGRVQHLGVAFDPALKAEHLYEHFPADHPAVRRRRSLSCITAAALCIRRPLFERQGGFHETYVNGFEDVDLCLGLAAEGWAFSCIPESVVYHIASQSEGRFDHTAHNSAVLQERHGHRMRPDLHRFGRADGYRLGVNEWLMSYLAPAAEREAELDAALPAAGTGFDPGRCWEALQSEPLWAEGYDRLAAFLEQRAMWPEAAEARWLRTVFRPGVAAYGALARAAARAGADAMAAEAAAKYTRYARHAADCGFLRNARDAIAEPLRGMGADDLACLYDGMVEKMCGGGA